MSISKQKRLASISSNFGGKRFQKFLISNMAANKKRTWQEFQKMVGEKRSKNSTTMAKSKCPSSIMVQRMSSAPNRSKKYEPFDTRDFVDFTDYDELNIENIRDAGERFTTCHKDLATFCSATEGPRAFSQSRYLGKSFIMSDSQWMSHQLENHLGQVWVESSKCHHQSWEVKVAGFTATVTRMGMQGLQQPTLICYSLSQQQLFQSLFQLLLFFKLVNWLSHLM